MNLIALAKKAFPEAWAERGTLQKADAVSHTLKVLETLQREYGGGQVDAVVKGLIGTGR